MPNGLAWDLLGLPLKNPIGSQNPNPLLDQIPILSQSKECKFIICITRLLIISNPTEQTRTKIINVKV